MPTALKSIQALQPTMQRNEHNEIFYEKIEEGFIDGHPVLVKTIQLDENFKKSQDPEQVKRFFNNRKTIIEYKNKEVTLTIYGEGREERIDVEVNGKELSRDNPFIANLLSLKETFEPAKMYLIDSMRKQKEYEIHNDKLARFLCPFVRSRILPEKHPHDFILSKDELLVSFKKTIKDKLKEIKQADLPALVTIPVYDENYGHWFLLNVNINKDGHVTLNILESINTPNQVDGISSLTDLKKFYYDKLAIPLNEILDEIDLLKGKSIAQDEIEYSQHLQYGTMSCGIVATLSEDFLEQDSVYLADCIVDESAFKKIDNPIEITFIPKVGEQGKTVSVSHETYIKIANRIIDPDKYNSDKSIPDDLRAYLDAKPRLHNKPKPKTTSTFFHNPKSARYTLLEEVVRRADVAIAQSTMDELHKELKAKFNPL